MFSYKNFPEPFAYKSSSNIISLDSLFLTVIIDVGLLLTCLCHFFAKAANYYGKCSNSTGTHI